MKGYKGIFSCEGGCNIINMVCVFTALYCN